MYTTTQHRKFQLPLQIRDEVKKKRITGYLYYFGAIAIFGTCLFWSFIQLQKILDMDKAWQEGVVAEGSEVEGANYTSALVFQANKFRVKYHVQGKLFIKQFEVSTLFKELDVLSTPIVKYLPEDPNSIGLSSIAQGRNWIWLAWISIVAFGILFPLAVAWMGRFQSQEYLSVVRCSQRADLIAVPVIRTSTTRIEKKGHIVVYYLTLFDRQGRPFESNTVFREIESPLYADADEKQLLALVHPDFPQRPIFLRSDWYPYVV